MDSTHDIQKYDEKRNKKNSVYDNIKIKHYIKMGDICSICLDEIWSKNDAYLTECGHVFHTSCICKYYNMYRDPNCPICRCDTFIPNSLLLYRYNTNNYNDKLDDFWLNINLIFPRKCYYSMDMNHHRGMKKKCIGCMLYKMGRYETEKYKMI